MQFQLPRSGLLAITLSIFCQIDYTYLVRFTKNEEILQQTIWELLKT